MAKGSQICPVRIPEDLLRELTTAIRRRNAVSADAPHNRSTFILAAVRDKLKHMARSRRTRSRKAVNRE